MLRHFERMVVVLASTSTMSSKCSSSRVQTVRLRRQAQCAQCACPRDATQPSFDPSPEDPTLQSFIRVIVFSLVFLFFVRPGPHPIPKDRQVNDSTLSQPRVNESTQQRSTHSRSMKSNARVNQSRQQSFNATEDHTEPTDFVGLHILGGHVFLLGLHLCLESTIFAVLFFCWIAPVSGMQDFCCLGFF